MKRASRWIGRSRLAAWILAAALPAWAVSAATLTFEDAVRQSDRIVVATMGRAGVETLKLPDGGELAVGIKDPATGLVFTPYRVRIALCLLDSDTSCRPGDGEVLIPGGTIYETVDGERRLRTWEIAGAAGAPLPPAGTDVLLFLKNRNGRYLPLNDGAARVRVDRSSEGGSVVLRFSSPRFLSSQGREAAQARAVGANPVAAAPEFAEAVPLDRLKELIALVRQVPTPTSGTPHATPVRPAPGDAVPIRE